MIDRYRRRPGGALAVAIGLMLIVGWYLYLQWLGGVDGFREPCNNASVLFNAQVQQFFPPRIQCYPDGSTESFSLTSLFTNGLGVAVMVVGAILVILGTVQLLVAARQSFQAMRNSRPSIFG